ncbi:MAG TPA: ABC transporter substrate-binding protein [Candidatus Acidoferrales bacterium]|nr:ABC transporter substrate-binding protein [Candidatus Acidoferrales bacterium]
MGCRLVIPKAERRRVLAICVLTVFALVATAGYAAELTRLRVGSLISGEFSQAYIAQKKGFFEKNGLSVELIYFQGGSQAIQAMLGGDIPLTVTAGPEGVIAKLQGADIVLLSANNPTMQFSLFVPPEIKKIEELRGKRAGISRFGSSSDFCIRYIFKSAGMAESDVLIVQIGDNPTRLAALKSNAIQASVFTTPNSVRARKAGFVSLVDAYKLGLKFQGSGIASTGAFLRDHRPVVEQFFKGFLEGVAYAKSNKEESMRLIKDFLKLRDQDEVEETYQVIIRDIQPRKPYPTKEGVETVLKTLENTLPKAKNVRPEDLIDESVLRRLDQSGFIDNLYR